MGCLQNGKAVGDRLMLACIYQPNTIIHSMGYWRRQVIPITARVYEDWMSTPCSSAKRPDRAGSLFTYVITWYGFHYPICVMGILSTWVLTYGGSLGITPKRRTPMSSTRSSVPKPSDSPNLSQA